MVSVHNQDKVISSADLSDVMLKIVDDLIRAQRLDHRQVFLSAYGGDLRTKVFGKLHGKNTDAAPGAVDQHLFPGLILPRSRSPCRAVTADIGTAAAVSNETAAGL